MEEFSEFGEGLGGVVLEQRLHGERGLRVESTLAQLVLEVREAELRGAGGQAQAVGLLDFALELLLEAGRALTGFLSSLGALTAAVWIASSRWLKKSCCWRSSSSRRARFSSRKNTFASSIRSR